MYILGEIQMKLFNNTQADRSLLSKCGVDEQIFLSDVIKSFLTRMVQIRRCFLTTCTNKVHEEKNIKQMSHYAQETGRSMVEMLGVLAIIGVLSVGGIAGYSKAMYKHKITTTINNISHIVSSIRTIFNGKYDGLDTDNPELMKSTKIIPDNMWNDNEIINAFGGNIKIFGLEFGNYASFAIHIGGLPSTACIELATQNWTLDSDFLVVGGCGDSCDSAYITDVIADGIVDNFSENIEGEAYTPYWSGSMPVKDAVLGCTCENNNCHLMLGYK